MRLRMGGGQSKNCPSEEPYHRSNDVQALHPTGFSHWLGATPGEHGLGMNAAIDLEVWQLEAVHQLHPGSRFSLFIIYFN